MFCFVFVCMSVLHTGYTYRRLCFTKRLRIIFIKYSTGQWKDNGLYLLKTILSLHFLLGSGKTKKKKTHTIPTISSVQIYLLATKLKEMTNARNAFLSHTIAQACLPQQVFQLKMLFFVSVVFLLISSLLFYQKSRVFC